MRKAYTLQYAYNFLWLLIKNTKIAELPKEKTLNNTLTYFNCFKELLPVEWSDYKQYRITHIVCLNAFAIAGNKIIPSNYNFVSNYAQFTKRVSNNQKPDMNNFITINVKNMKRKLKDC